MKRSIKIILIIAVLILAAGAAVWFAKEAGSSNAQVSDFGFKDIGEFATEECILKIVETSDNSKEIFGWKVFKSYFVFSYDATVKAGIDFGEIEVNVDDVTKTINVNMPKAKIFDVSIDNDSLTIYQEKHNALNPITLDDFNDAQADLKEKALKEAEEKGILELAEDNAENYIINLIRSSSNLKDYVVVVK